MVCPVNGPNCGTKSQPEADQSSKDPAEDKGNRGSGGVMNRRRADAGAPVRIRHPIPRA